MDPERLAQVEEKERQHAAYHEAGHAVLLAALRERWEHARIWKEQPTRQDERAWRGTTAIGTLDRLNRPLVGLAGAAAEFIQADWVGGDWEPNDIAHVFQMEAMDSGGLSDTDEVLTADEPPTWAFRKVVAVLLNNWQAVETVKEMLLQKGKVTAAEIEPLVNEELPPWMDPECKPFIFPPSNGEADHAGPSASTAAPLPRLTIQRSSGIFLVLTGKRPTTLERRFAGLFRQTWRMIPLGARRAMVRHWRKLDPSKVAIVMPWVMLYPFTPDRDACASCGLGGSHLEFDSRSIDAMSDDAARALIAHELVHVLQWATGSMKNLMGGPRDGVPHDLLAEEIDAQDTLTDWGIDEEPLLQWQGANWEKENNPASVKRDNRRG